MEFELLSALRGKVGSKDVLLPRRQSFFAREPTARAHHAALSFTALVAYKSRNSPGYKILLCKRSEDVAVYRGLFGVIPGGMFQPEISPHEERNVPSLHHRGIREELFSANSIVGGGIHFTFFMMTPIQDGSMRPSCIGRLKRAFVRSFIPA